MDGASKKEVLRKTNKKVTCIQNQKDTIEISGSHNEEGGFVEFDKMNE